MTGVLLIGFDYYHLSGEENLLGIVNDLEMVYRFTRRIRPDRTLIISDLHLSDSFEGTNSNSSWSRETYNSKNLNFLREVEITPIKTQFDFKRIVYSFIRRLERVFIYYTGHADSKGFHLSLKTPISLEEYLKSHPMVVKGPPPLPETGWVSTIPPDQESLFRAYRTQFKDSVPREDLHRFQMEILDYSEMKFLIQQAHPQAEIIFLMDCCSGDSFDLPFVFNRNSRLFKLKKNHFKIPSQEIVTISSSLKHQSSLSHLEGSLFTLEIFSKLEELAKDGNVRYSRLVDEVGLNKLNQYFQTLNIHSSRPDLNYIWHWVFDYSKYQIQERDGILLIRRFGRL